MNLVLLSDTHLLWQTPVGRLDDTAETGLRKLEYVLEWGQSHNVIILQAGDFFDRPRSWYLLPEVISLLRRYKVPIYCVFGQHDQYMYSQETRYTTSLGVLAKMGLVHILGKKPFIFNWEEEGHCQLYGAGQGEEIPSPEKERSLNILVIHKMIVKEKLWPAQEDYIYAGDFLERHEEFALILCGDAHQKFIDISKEGRTICNAGPLIRKSVDLWNHKPGFFIADTEGDVIDWIEVPHEAAEKVLTRQHIDDKEKTREMLEEFIAAVGSGEMEVGVSFEENLIAFIEKNDIEQEIVDIISTVMGKKEE